MTKISTVLFDFDGVIAHTEPQYDIYIEKLGEKYNLGIENFATLVKGTTTPYILENYFSHLSQEEQLKIEQDMSDFEQEMDFPLVNGVMKYINYLKENKYKVGLVTSSQEVKMKRALKLLNLSETFDTIVTAARIVDGKPNPMCYLLAAEDLNSAPKECIVFEDSFHGIQAGKSAGMRVVGLSTTINKKDLAEKVNHVIPDFSDLKQVVEFLA
ncbi:MAG: HAD family phosphatase [Prevotella sp.]|jgi:HAD superfamily hydrolase (TIGR01509 family)|nr:HAD family phosphatase [Prevotella sp.]